MAEQDLLGELAGNLLREERGRRAAEQQVEALETALRQADAARSDAEAALRAAVSAKVAADDARAQTEAREARAIGELRTKLDGLRQELVAMEQLRASERRALELEIERVRAESAAEIATLRARKLPSMHTLVAIREEAQEQLRAELTDVRRTADEAIGALRQLIERKESVLAEGRAALERLHPQIVEEALRTSDVPLNQRLIPLSTHPSSAPTPASGVSIAPVRIAGAPEVRLPGAAVPDVSDYPEIILDGEPDKT